MLNKTPNFTDLIFYFFKKQLLHSTSTIDRVYTRDNNSEITIITNKTPSIKLTTKINSLTRKYHKRFGLFGDYNLYVTKDDSHVLLDRPLQEIPYKRFTYVYDYCPMGNIFDIKQDSKLFRWLSPHVIGLYNVDYRTQSFVYLMRMLEKEKSNPFDKNKYAKYLKHSQTEIENFKDCDQLCDLICKDYFSENITTSINHFLNYNNPKDPYWFELNYDKYFSICFFNRWVGVAKHKNTFDAELLAFKDYSEQELKIVAAQIEWEIWSLNHQYCNLYDYYFTIGYLKDLKMIFKHINSLEKIQIDNFDIKIQIIKHLIIKLKKFQSQSTTHLINN